MGVLCDLDAGLDLPNCTLPTARMLEMVKGDSDISSFELEMNVVRVNVGASSYRLEDTALGFNGPEKFRGFPALPQFWNAEPEWRSVQRVLHVAPKKHPNPAQLHVHFRKDGGVACKDEYRFARVLRGARTDADCVVPIGVFKNWPSREVWSFFDSGNHHAFFRIGLDELRMACWQRDTFPDWKRYEQPHRGGEAIVEVAELTRNIKRAKTLAQNGTVRLDFSPGKCTITSWNDALQTFMVDIVADITEPGVIVVPAGYLLDAVGELQTPNVWLGYTHGPNGFLRVEGPGDFLELIWAFDPTDKHLDADGNLSGK